MPQSNQIVYSHQELAASLVKEQGIHEGHWMVFIAFNWNATNLNVNGSSGPGFLTVIPAIGIQRVDEPSPLTVDASVVNPSLEALPSEKFH